jgi:hypothetical protein
MRRILTTLLLLATTLIRATPLRADSYFLDSIEWKVAMADSIGVYTVDQIAGPTDLVKALGRMQTSDTLPMDLVFRGLIQRMTVFRKDLEAAGIAYVDAKGEYADFHSLRKTFGTMLTLAGVPQRVVMELMRHSDMRLYDSQYSVINWSCGDQVLVAISNVDFDYLSTLYGFAEGDTFYENIGFRNDESSADADPTIAAWLAWARKELPIGVPGYVIVSGTGSPEMTQGLDALHQYFGANEGALIQEYSLKQAQWSAEELELKLHPPVRPNTIINYWPIKSSVYRTSQ